MKQTHQALADMAVRKIARFHSELGRGAIGIDELIESIMSVDDQPDPAKAVKRLKELNALIVYDSPFDILLSGEVARYIRYRLEEKGIWIVAVKDQFKKDFPKWLDRMPDAGAIKGKLLALKRTVSRYACGESERCVGYVLTGDEATYGDVRSGGNWLYGRFRDNNKWKAEVHIEGQEKKVDRSKHISPSDNVIAIMPRARRAIR